MASSGVSVAPECIAKFNELKLGKQLSYVIFKISDEWKEIVVEEEHKKSGDHNSVADFKKDYEDLVQKLKAAKSKNKKGEEGMGGRYAVVDVVYEAKDGSSTRTAITFISWVPDDSPQYPRMMYSSSKDALKRSLNGLHADVQANDADDIEYESIIARVSK